ncbi:alpha-amylase family glycosyl hydrolase [Candidatus Latescibacterota bacterium]
MKKRHQNIINHRKSNGILIRISFLLIVLLILHSLNVISSEPKEYNYQYDVPFDNVPNTDNIIMYEVNPLVFSESGDLEGIQSKLDSIKNLGVNVIWLMPIYPIGEFKGIGSPYAVRDYKKINPDYGDFEDLRALVKKAHKLDMAVIMDWVGNHTAWDNPWITNHKDWYTQENGEIIHPAGTNWRDVADLNYANHEMQDEMIESMKYWILTANIDGYRFDYADGVPTEFWNRAIDTLKSIPNRKLILLAEGANKEHFSSGFDLIYDWNFYDRLITVFNENSSPSSLAKLNAVQSDYIPDGKYTLRFISNHDKCAWENTPLDEFQGKDGSMAAFVLTAYIGGIPLLYNGQEVGCPIRLPFFSSGTAKIDWSINPEMTAEYKKLIHFRKSSNAVKTGSIEIFDNNRDIMAFKRISGDKEVLVIVNVRNSVNVYKLPPSITDTNWQDAFTEESVSFNVSVTLQPFSYIILKRGS